MADANALVNALALSGSADPSDLIRNQLQAQQQQALAQALMTQGLTPMSGTESVGGVAIRRSPMEGAAKLAALLSGQSLQGQANDKSIQAALGQGQAMRAMFGLGDPAQVPQQAQQPQGGQPGMPAPHPSQGGPLSVAGASPMTNMLSYSTDPAQHMKAVMEQYAATPEMKQAAAAYGVGTPGYMAALRAQVQKAGYIAPAEVKAGNTALDANNKPVFQAPQLPLGATADFDEQGRPTNVRMIPNAGSAITASRGAEQSNDVIDVPLDNGKTQKMTKSDFLNWTRSNKFTVAPGTEGEFRAALVKAGDPDAVRQFDARYGMPGVTTGQSTEGAEAAKIGSKDIVTRNQGILADANAAPLDIESLKRMAELASSSNFGPGASNVAKWKAFAAQVPGIGLISDPATLEQQQTNVTLMKKYMSNMAGRMSGSSGTGTDARLQNAIDSLPNDAAPDAAIKLVAPMLIAQRTARLDEAKLRSPLGNDSAAIQNFETKWRGAYSPLAYEATLATRGMNPQQAAQYVKTHFSPSQAQEIAQSRAALKQLGATFGAQ